MKLTYLIIEFAYIHNKTKTFLHLSHDAEHWNLIGGRVKIHEDSFNSIN